MKTTFETPIGEIAYDDSDERWSLNGEIEATFMSPQLAEFLLGCMRRAGLRQVEDGECAEV